MGVITEPVRQLLAADSSLAGFGIEVLSAGDGRAAVQMVVSESFANGHRIAHGGVIYTLADTAFACAANSQAPGTATAGASILYFSPAHVGEELLAEAVVRHLAGRQSLVDVTVRCGPRLVAEYRGRGTVLRHSDDSAGD
jgi:acyl-CoA thioesterase